jgi:ABC-type branched-subunit amino acid transport system substrate-binding protein
MKNPKPQPGIFFLLLSAAMLMHQSVAGQADSTVGRRPMVSVLIPFHLDSLFELDKYKFGSSIPRFALPYLEFYNGLKLATDSLAREGVDAHIEVFDSRRGGSYAIALAHPSLRKSDLIIALVTSTAELRKLSDLGAELDIPVVSATFPNDGGVKNRPQLYVTNTTLRTHCHALYDYLYRNHAAEKIIVVTRKGRVEASLKSWIEEQAAQKSGLKISLKEHFLSDSFQVQDITRLLDSTQKNILLAPTMDAAFAQRLLRNLSSIRTTYKTQVVGMPSWDEIDLRKSEYKGVEIVYGSPFVSSLSNPELYQSLSRQYSARQNSKPSDMALKGFEMIYRFTKTISQYSDRASFESHINEAAFRLFCSFSFQPVVDEETKAVHYYENEKVYFLLKTDGQLKALY